jgi:hypothetical protein
MALASAQGASAVVSSSTTVVSSSIAVLSSSNPQRSAQTFADNAPPAALIPGIPGVPCALRQGPCALRQGWSYDAVAAHPTKQHLAAQTH